MSSTSPRRIALISDHGDPAAKIGAEEAGGQNVYVRQVGESLAKLGWQVDMFTRRVCPNDPVIVQHLPNCRTVRLSAGPARFVPRDELLRYMPEFLTSFREFQRQTGHRYPVVHTNYWLSAWVGLQLKKSTDVQIVHTYHSLGAVKYLHTAPQPKIAEARLAVERQILEQADCVVATSPQERDHMRSLVSKKGHIEVIPCGFDHNRFYPRSKAEARHKVGIDPDRPVVLFVGRFDPRKGIETLVRACAQLQTDFQLIIVGGGGQADRRERERIRLIVREVGLESRTLFVGPVGHDTLPLYCASADVCVIPSHYEPFGLVSLEAMACGVPVIASEVGGLQFTVVPEKTGLLVPHQDETSLAKAMARVLADAVWAQQLGQQGSIRVSKHFRWDQIAVQLSRLYAKLGSHKLSGTFSKFSSKALISTTQ
ncbi:MAG: glycosyltransferase family 1 protein [Blastocatellia bacterium]|nr:glycosyltransferase family 1 protein [Blastocatellia bacterium]